MFFYIYSSFFKIIFNRRARLFFERPASRSRAKCIPLPQAFSVPRSARVRRSFPQASQANAGSARKESAKSPHRIADDANALYRHKTDSSPVGSDAPPPPSYLQSAEQRSKREKAFVSVTTYAEKAAKKAHRADIQPCRSRNRPQTSWRDGDYRSKSQGLRRAPKVPMRQASLPRSSQGKAPARCFQRRSIRRGVRPFHR